MRVLTCISALAMVALLVFANGAQAEASWRSALAWSSAKVNTTCPGDVCANSNWNLAANTEVSCASAGSCGDGVTACDATAWALGRNNWTGAHRVHAAGCGSAGSLAPAATTMDTLTVSLVRLNATTLRLTLVGVIGPGSIGGAGADSMRVVVWDYGTFSNPEDTFDPIPPGSIKWLGAARISFSGVLTTSGSIVPGDFTLVAGEYRINKNYDIAYAGPDNVIAVGSDVGHAEAVSVPALSVWGSALLILVLAGTAVYFIVRRRVVLQT